MASPSARPLWLVPRSGNPRRGVSKDVVHGEVVVFLDVILVTVVWMSMTSERTTMGSRDAWRGAPLQAMRDRWRKRRGWTELPQRVPHRGSGSTPSSSPGTSEAGQEEQRSPEKGPALREPLFRGPDKGCFPAASATPLPLGEVIVFRSWFLLVSQC